MFPRALSLPRQQVLLPPLHLSRPVPRQKSTFSKFINAVKGEDLPTGRKGLPELSKGTLEKAKEADLLSRSHQAGHSQRGREGSSSSNSNARSSDSRLPSSPREERARRGRRKPAKLPSRLVDSEGRLNSRVSAPRSPKPPAVVSKAHEGLQQHSKSVLDQIPRDVFRSQAENPSTLVDSKSPLPPQGTSIERTEPIASPCPIPSTFPVPSLPSSTSAAEHIKRTESLTLRQAPHQHRFEAPSSFYGIVELEPVPTRQPSNSPASTPPSNRPTSISTKETVRPLAILENDGVQPKQAEKVSEKIETQQTQTVVEQSSKANAAFAVSESSPPVHQSASSITTNPLILRRYKELREQESWMHPENAKYHQWNPSSGLNGWFRLPHSSITRRAHLQASHLQKVDWIRTYREKQDALLRPTSQILEERKLIDEKLERSRQLYWRFLEGKEALISEQQFNSKLLELNHLIETLERFRAEFLVWHQSHPRDVLTGHSLRSRLEDIIASESRIRLQPSSFPPPLPHAPWSPPLPVVEALRFVDRDCTKPYFVPFSEYNKAVPQGPSARELERLEKLIRRRQRKIETLLREISFEGWRTRN